MSAQAWVVMGVSGSGKTTVAARVAERLGWCFLEGDDYHPAANREKMLAGAALADGDRWPWLDALGAAIADRLAADEDVVASCSALKRRYRDRLRRFGVTRFVLLDVPAEELVRRLELRPVEMIRPDLLASQLATLEWPGEAERDVVVVDGGRAVAEVVDAVAQLG